MIERYKNPDGKTYNGVAFFADLLKIPPEEVAWMAERTRQLKSEGVATAREISQRIRVEARSRPWNTNPAP